ncbi:MAG: hypothetical protein IT581_06550 [Verrucomicrobiales bacterium]|nr:hypothetical protein [Verrucomicrobiales bacterium]
MQQMDKNTKPKSLKAWLLVAVAIGVAISGVLIIRSELALTDQLWKMAAKGSRPSSKYDQYPPRDEHGWTTVNNTQEWFTINFGLWNATNPITGEIVTNTSTDPDELTSVVGDFGFTNSLRFLGYTKVTNVWGDVITSFYDPRTRRLIDQRIDRLRPDSDGPSNNEPDSIGIPVNQPAGAATNVLWSVIQEADELIRIMNEHAAGNRSNIVYHGTTYPLVRYVLEDYVVLRGPTQHKNPPEWSKFGEVQISLRDWLSLRIADNTERHFGGYYYSYAMNLPRFTNVLTVGRPIQIKEIAP